MFVRSDRGFLLVRCDDVGDDRLLLNDSWLDLLEGGRAHVDGVRSGVDT